MNAKPITWLTFFLVAALAVVGLLFERSKLIAVAAWAGVVVVGAWSAWREWTA